MAVKITWIKPLDDVLGRKTQEKTFTSKKELNIKLNVYRN